MELTKEGLKETGYEEVGLVSLSTADYSDVGNMVREVSKVTTPKHVAISLPSLRADRIVLKLQIVLGKLSTQVLLLRQRLVQYV